MRQLGSVALGAIAVLLVAAAPSLAHHPFGGGTPDNVVEAFLSGTGHPLIGIDHLAFVIASGLLAAAIGGGLLIPAAFVVASMLGTGIHLMSIDLPVPEVVISASVLLFGVFLALKTPPSRPIAIGLAAIAGIFHGHAYGEAIFGAEMGALVAYLLGFAFIQMAIAVAAYWIAKAVLDKLMEPSGLALRFAGFVICGVGVTFLTTLVVDAIFPA
ncbi:HupE/UreJ family protein [Synechococcus sp. PCC 7336]|uniref:HupE/UreJ family protein n=1 Tax=Synechococcus sp. PCC 7336 TaxID=195250 RepID=UPI000367F3B3|nr:HupE/UreJ family protein [Synechococcus sp. PCC 7336]